MAGIINIQLKQNVDLGVSAGLTVGAAKQDKYNASGNLGYQAGKLTTFSNLGIFSDDRDVSGINDLLRYDKVDALLSATNQDIVGNNGFKGQNFGTNVDYKLNARNVLSNGISINHRRATDNSRADYSELNGSGTLLDRYFRPRENESKGLNIDYTSAFKHTIEPRKNELSAEVRFNRSHDEDVDEHLARVGVELGRLDGHADPAAARQHGRSHEERHRTGGLHAQRSARRSWRSGLKSNARWLDRDYAVVKDSLGDENWVRSSLSNAFSFNEQVHAAYAVVSRSLGKVDAQAGLRAEYANRDFQLADKSYPYHYTSFFPSGVLSYNLTHVEPGEGQLLAPHPPPRHAGAQPVPDLLRRPERLPRQPGAESGVHRRVRAGLQQERQVRVVPALALLPAHHQRHPRSSSTRTTSSTDAT